MNEPIDASTAAFHLDRLVGLEPPDPGARVRRARIAMAIRRLDQANEDFAA